jgi:hypothetical protein
MVAVGGVDAGFEASLARLTSATKVLYGSPAIVLEDLDDAALVGWEGANPTAQGAMQAKLLALMRMFTKVGRCARRWVDGRGRHAFMHSFNACIDGFIHRLVFTQVRAKMDGVAATYLGRHSGVRAFIARARERVAARAGAGAGAGQQQPEGPVGTEPAVVVVEEEEEEVVVEEEATP